MAVPTNTVESYAFSDTIREDLADVIYDVSPLETPFLSTIAKVDATATFHEWQTDELAAASATNAAIEGDDATGAAISAPTRLGNYTQILTKTVVLSGTYQSTRKAGIADAMAREVVRRGQEIKRDLESSLLANNARVAGNASTARELAGVPAWLATNTNGGTGAADPTGDGTDARTDGTQRAFTEEDLADVIRQIYESGGSPDMIMVGPYNKQVASGFTGVATKFKDVDDKKIIASADVYVSDYGEMNIIPNRFMRARDALVLQSDMWAAAYLRNMEVNDLGRSGDSDKKQIICEVTLEARNERSSGIVADLTTSSA